MPSAWKLVDRLNVKGYKVGLEPGKDYWRDNDVSSGKDRFFNRFLRDVGGREMTGRDFALTYQSDTWSYAVGESQRAEHGKTA